MCCRVLVHTVLNRACDYNVSQYLILYFYLICHLFSFFTKAKFNLVKKKIIGPYISLFHFHKLTVND